MEKKGFYIPDGFQLSGRSPTMSELVALWDWLYKNENKKRKKVLEFGSGITTWTIYDSVDPELYVCMETIDICMNSIHKLIPSVKFISTNWSDIPDEKYDLLFVDSSTAAPKEIKPMTALRPFRDDAIHYIKNRLAEDALIIVHDWNHKDESWRAARRYLEKNNFDLVWSYTGRYGFGAYTKHQEK